MHTLETKHKIEARLSKGLHDVLPQQAIARQHMIATIQHVYELYGFVPLHTPAIEYSDVLTGSAGHESDTNRFHVISPEHEHLGLRFDLTVPLARVVAQYPELPRPFRRYQVAPVWRADKPDPGRFREFTQFDIDSVGVPSHIADTEIIAAMCDTLDALHVERYVVRFSSRAILNLLLDFAGIPREYGVDVFRVLDKLEKVGLHNVRLELMGGYKNDAQDTIEGIGLTAAQVDRIEAFLGLHSAHRDEMIAGLRDLFAHVPGAQHEIDVIDRISGHLHRLGYGDDRVVIDLSVARGLAYYTGPVFEASLLDAPRFGSVFSGGRYDDLITRFHGERIPATGASIGVDRLLAALTHLHGTKHHKATAHVLVTSMDPSLESDYIDMTWELRRAGIPAELYLGAAESLGKQLKHANHCGIPIAVIAGTHEKAHGTVTLKNLIAGSKHTASLHGREEWLAARAGQITVPRADLVTAVRHMLDGHAESGA
jgi:histidyl-tRNA synthetase